MLWDIFILFPGNASADMLAAGLDVMDHALKSSNESCIASAIHGLGHWVHNVPRATQILEQWLRHPTTPNEEILEYARQATTGCVL